MKKSLCLFTLFLILSGLFHVHSLSFNADNFKRFLNKIQPGQSLTEINKELQNHHRRGFKAFSQENKHSNNGGDISLSKVNSDKNDKTFEVVSTSRDKLNGKMEEESKLADDYFKRFRFSSAESNASSFLSSGSLNSEQTKLFNSYEMTTSLPPILSGWLSIKSDFFSNNNNLPSLTTVEGPMKYTLDDKERLLNPAFHPTPETAKLKLTKLHFYARINEQYLYFTPNAQEFMNIINLPLIKLSKVSNLNDEDNCFEATFLAMKNKDSSNFTFCATTPDETIKFVCLMERLSSGKEYKQCLEKVQLSLEIKGPKIVKRKLKQPFIVIPLAQRYCNLGWGYLSKGNDWECLCKEGKEQSPIDLPPAKSAIVTPIRPYFDYDVVNTAEKKLKIVNENNMLRIKADSEELIKARGFGRIVTQDGTVYYGTEILFHTPSEHTIDGKRFDLEVQIVHEAKTKGDFGKRTVLCFLYEGKPGVYNRFLDDIEFFNQPNPHDAKRLLQNRFSIPSALNESDEPLGTVMKPFSFYTYQGSLTQPPCQEGVIYYVASKAIPASVTALDLFKEALRMPDFEDQLGNVITSKDKPLYNARNTVPLNGRAVFLYDSEMFDVPISYGKKNNDDEKYLRKRDGHFEKQEVEVTDYVYVENNTPSGTPGSIVVSEEEANSKL